jgi:hypothetical protein
MSVRRMRSAVAQSQFFVKDRWRLGVERRRYSGMSEELRDRVSVPIATYDRIEVLVERTLPALLGQTHQDVEIIVVGDGTPPGLFRLLDRVDDPRVRTLLLPSRTSYPSDPLERWMVAGWRPRNVGADLATGGWLLWMSDDDIVLPTGITTLLEAARREPEADVVSAGFEVQGEKPRVDLPSEAETGLPFPIAGMPALMVRIYTRAFRWNRLSYLRSVHRPSDYDLLVRMHRAGLTFTSVDEIVAVVPMVPGTGAVGSRAFIDEERRRSLG